MLACTSGVRGSLGCDTFCLVQSLNCQSVICCLRESQFRNKYSSKLNSGSPCDAVLEAADSTK